MYNIILRILHSSSLKHYTYELIPSKMQTRPSIVWLPNSETDSLVNSISHHFSWKRRLWRTSVYCQFTFNCHVAEKYVNFFGVIFIENNHKYFANRAILIFQQEMSKQCKAVSKKCLHSLRLFKLFVAKRPIRSSIQGQIPIKKLFKLSANTRENATARRNNNSTVRDYVIRSFRHSEVC